MDFDAPRVCFGRSGRLLTLQIGPTSRVGLDTTYLSERLRICRGAGSGVPFVFRADTVADGAPLAQASQQCGTLTLTLALTLALALALALTRTPTLT